MEYFPQILEKNTSLIKETENKSTKDYFPHDIQHLILNKVFQAFSWLHHRWITGKSQANIRWIENHK